MPTSIKDSSGISEIAVERDCEKETKSGFFMHSTSPKIAAFTPESSMRTITRDGQKRIIIAINAKSNPIGTAKPKTQ